MLNPHYVCGGGRHEEKTAIKHRGVYSIPLIKTTKTEKASFLLVPTVMSCELIPLSRNPNSTNDKTVTPSGQMPDYNAKTT